MRRPAETKVRAGAEKSSTTSLPAPVGGLNARDSVANMPPEDAIALENWFPLTTSLQARFGYSAWNTFTGICQTVMVYSGLTATKIFPCVKNGATFSIFDGSSAGALSTAVVGGGGATVEALGNTRFDYINFGTAGGQYLIAVNGTNNPVQFDGTTWTVSGLTGGTPANYQTIGIYSNRIFIIEKNSFVVRYWATQTIAGASATALNLASLYKLGGHLMAIVSVTDDGGGLVDYVGFVSSEGEVICFTGTDPATTAWTIAAHFRIGRPVIMGNRTWCKWGTDALVLCTDGLYPLRKAIAADRKIEGLSVSDKIRNLINGDIALYGANYGWQAMVHPNGNKIIVNVPYVEDSATYQYVMNTQTGAWCKFTGWTGFNFEVAGLTLYMGGNGVMVKADTTAYDGASNITSQARQANNYLGTRGRAKHMKLLRPILATDRSYHLAISCDTDFKSVDPGVYRNVSAGNSDPWNGIWSVAWSGAPVVSLNWYGVTGVGHAVSPRLNIQNDGASLQWSATDVVYETGGVVA